MEGSKIKTGGTMQIRHIQNNNNNNNKVNLIIDPSSKQEGVQGTSDI